MKNQVFSKQQITFLFIVCISVSLPAQMSVFTLDYIGFGTCAVDSGCDGDVPGDTPDSGTVDRDYDCENGATPVSISFNDPVPSGETVTDIVVEHFGSGSVTPAMSTEYKLNGSLISSQSINFSSQDCNACDVKTYSDGDAAGLSYYNYGASNTLSYSTNTGIMCGYYAVVTLQYSVVLPVELTAFKARQNGSFNYLIWNTDTEVDNEGFYIERSTDGHNWKTLDFIEGAGNTVAGRNYNYMDIKPLNGMNYYRLVQQDFNGDREISQIVTVDFKNNVASGFGLYPNPSNNGKVNIKYTSARNEEITVEVFTLTGKLLIHETRPVVDGTNNLSFDLSEIGTGLFTVQLGNRNQQYYQKLLIR